MAATNGGDEYVTKGGKHPTGKHGLLGYFLNSKGPSGFGSGSTAEQVAMNWEGKGKVVLITGASTGLGLESARVLAGRGAEVIMGVRDMEKAKRNAEAIRQQTPGAQLTLLPLDLASMDSVKNFAKEVLALNKPINILMLNAGIMATPFGLSADGYEQQFATNHLGHFLLTKLLLPTVLDSARAAGAPQGRIVALSSLAMWRAYPEGLREVGLVSDSGYTPWEAYGQSKLCNALFARALADRVKGQPVKVVSCHPGVINTELSRSMGIPPLAKAVAGTVLAPILKSVPQGAATQVYCATSPDVENYEYYSDCNLQPSSALSHSRTLGDRLWEVSEQIVAGTYKAPEQPQS